MTEFEKWWTKEEEIHKAEGGGTKLAQVNRVLAEKAWHAAQRALLRTVAEPPYIPKIGDKIRFLGLCHPLSLGKVKEVTDVTPHTIDAHWVETKDGDRYSGGVLSEVEKVNGPQE